MASSDDDDRYVTMGRDVVSGKTPAATATGSDDDPYVQQGRSIVAATPTATSAAPVPQSYGMSITGIPSIDRFLLGGSQGIEDVAETIGRGVQWVDRTVPVLGQLDRYLHYDPDKAVNALAADRARWNASLEGQSYPGQAGRFVGDVAATAPVTGPVANALGAGVRAAGVVLPEIPYVGGILGRAATRAVQGAGAGAVQGLGTATDQPLGEAAKEGAIAGAIAGPTLGAAADVAAGTVGAISRGIKNITGKAAVEGVEQTLADAEARARAAQQAQAQATPPAPATGAPQPGTGPTPQPAGAQATPGATLAATAPDAARLNAERLRGINQVLNETAKPGDFTEYVPGEKVTLPEALMDPHLAGVQRNLMPGEQRFTNQDAWNTERRGDMVLNRSGDAITLKNLEDDQAAQADKDAAAAWATKKPTTAQPVIDYINGRLNDTELSEFDPVKNALNKIQDKLTDVNGDVQTDPRKLYGVRRQLTYMLSSTGRKADPSYGDRDVMRELIGVRDVLDQQILAGAPKFQALLDNYKAAQPAIDTQQVLQDFHLTDSGKMTLENVNRALRSIRSGWEASGATPEKNLSDETMNDIYNLRRSLLRQNNRTLGAPIGSPTAYNIDLNQRLGTGMAHALINHLAGTVPGGDAASASILRDMSEKNIAKAKEALIQNFLAERQLSPPPQW